jgi:RimJ/RimL family protein N-acetyltransferase
VPTWRASKGTDPMHFAVIDTRSGRAVGTLALMRIDPANGAIEVGTVTFSPLLKHTPMSTEAQYLLMKLVFDNSATAAMSGSATTSTSPRSARPCGWAFSSRAFSARP